MRDELKSAVWKHGALSVTIYGAGRKLRWPAISWDIQDTVSMEYIFDQTYIFCYIIFKLQTANYFSNFLLQMLIQRLVLRSVKALVPSTALQWCAMGRSKAFQTACTLWTLPHVPMPTMLELCVPKIVSDFILFFNCNFFL